MINTMDIETLYETEGYEGLVDLIESRVNDRVFRDLIQEREDLYAELDPLNVELKIAKGHFPDNTGKKNTSFVKVREATLKVRAVNEKLIAVNNKINAYRANTAAIALYASEAREKMERSLGTFLSYDADTIGPLVSLGEFESGSPEWHNERRAGIGGSDVAKIMRVSEKYGASDYRDVMLTKLGLNKVEEVSDNRDVLSTPVGRGNSWEEYIRYMYADKHPEHNVAFCKTSWGGVGADHYKHANFDGLLLNSENVAEGVLEIKTGTHSPIWGEVEDGIFGVPENYRKQILWYALNAELSWGVLVAVLDDYDYREYVFTMSDPRVQEECAQIEKATRSFWAKIENMREDLSAGVNTVSTVRKGFAKSLNMKRSAEKLAAYTGEDFDTVYENVRSAFKNVAETGPYTQEQIHDTLVSLYASHNPADRRVPFIGIDLETNSAAVKNGRIIETGIIKLDVDGSLETLFSSVHGLPEIALSGLSVGETSIHRITEEKIAGVKTFDDPDTQREILAHLKSGILVAHNADFEDRFLTVNLAGYAEARDAGEIRILDTKDLVTYIMVDSKDNSLQSFAEDNGIPYIGAHAATTDTMMMLEALKNFQQTMFQNGCFVPTQSSETERADAIIYNTALENNR